MSAEGKHTATPPKWEVHDDQLHALTIVRPYDAEVRPEQDAGAGYGDYRGVIIAELKHQNDNPCVPKSRALANARLIVSAVNEREQVLEVLRTALDWLPTPAQVSENDYEPCVAFRAEIAELLRKAEEVPCQK